MHQLGVGGGYFTGTNLKDQTMMDMYAMEKAITMNGPPNPCSRWFFTIVNVLCVVPTFRRR